MSYSKLPDWRSQVGHAFADAVQDTLRKYDREVMDKTDPEVIAMAVMQDLGFSKAHRVPEVQRAVVRWCRGVVETEDRR